MVSVYVAGRTKDIGTVRRVQSIVRGFGGEITFDWTGAEGEIRESWAEKPDTATTLSDRERAAVRDADVLILVWHEHGGLGALLETGMAMALGKRVIVYGSPRESVFWYLPRVERAETVLEMTELLGLP